MPNHITNKLTIVAENAERLNEVLETLKTDEQEFDFNTLIPMPEELVINAFGHSKEELDYARTHEAYDADECGKLFGERFSEEMFLNARAQALNMDKYGYPTWYEWSCTNWGTKWNAYDIDVYRNSDTEVIITFNTAWSAPIEIYNALAEKFDDIEINVLWADEDMGYNCGDGYGSDGDFGYNMPEGGSDEAYEIYFECNEWARDEYVKVNGEWRYIDDLEDEEADS